MCVNFVYDLNGTKGPNKLGGDIGFMTAFYPTDSTLVAVMPLKNIQPYQSDYPEFSIGLANSLCRKNHGDDAKVANIEELKSIFVNRNFGLNVNDTVMSSTPASETTLYSLLLYSGDLVTRPKNE